MGLFCGTLTGLTVSAGSVASTPLVRYFLGGRSAGATALGAVFCAALTAITTYNRHHSVCWGIGAILAVAQVIGVALAERHLTRLKSSAGLRMVWSMVGIAGGIAMVAEAAKISSMSGVPLPFIHSGLLSFGWTALVGVVVGAVSQVMDLGGVLVVPACLMLLRIGVTASQGTALFCLLLVSLPGLLIYNRSGEVDRGSTAWMSLGGVFGGLVGAYYAFRLTHFLVTLFGISLALIGLGRFMGAGSPRVAVESGQ